MKKCASATGNALILVAAVVVVALPFIFRRDRPVGQWKEGDPVLVVVSPHIAVIRDEFALGFSEWHQRRFGQPVRIDWRAIGGTTEIMRYLQGEYVAAYRAWRRRAGLPWPDGAADAAVAKRKPADAALAEVWADFRAHDDANDYTTLIDVFFGGGVYDHSSAARQGFTVAPWPADQPPEGVLADADGVEMLPEGRGGEDWRSPVFFSAALSGFGICSNPDRLKDLGIARQPVQWRDLADPRYFGQIGVTDPTKSGSIAKAFEMIIHSECRREVLASGWTPGQIHDFEARIAAAKLPPGVMPEGVPTRYQDDVERGWLAGIHLVQRIGANARYFTDGAGKVPVDVASGDAAAGISIDFYSRVQAEVTTVNGQTRLLYVTPLGGSSISGDPISLLRGAPHPEIARRFLEYVLSEDGQKLWNYRPGTPGGPRKSALRRLPVRRDFYPDAEHPAVQARAEEHARHTSDDLLDPAVDAYHLAGAFEYQPRWTASHFGFFRQLVRVMCMDAGQELRAAWKAVADAGGPEANPEAAALLERLPDRPVPITWKTAGEATGSDAMEAMREWTLFFRNSYHEAKAAVTAAAP
ncbi:MAG: ABC transporter substrate-binding protein [Kiritimatiellia bacterium]|jgi:iron(III) transport system substrate-binding protein